MDPIKPCGSLDASKKAFSLWEEFRNFAFKGNVIDLAVGVIIGAAFGDIIKSLVKNIIMPLVSFVMPTTSDYNKWAWTWGDKTVPFGLFIADVVNFVILALVLFVFIVKFLGWLMRARKEEAAAAPPLTKEQLLLTEIRDLLQRQVQGGSGSG